MIIDLGFAKLVVSKGDPTFREVCVGLETKSGDYQDIAVINQTTTTRNGKMVYKDSVNVYVYADEQQEDFTEKFTIGLCDEFADTNSQSEYYEDGMDVRTGEPWKA